MHTVVVTLPCFPLCSHHAALERLAVPPGCAAPPCPADPQELWGAGWGRMNLVESGGRARYPLVLQEFRAPLMDTDRCGGAGVWPGAACGPCRGQLPSVQDRLCALAWRMASLKARLSLSAPAHVPACSRGLSLTAPRAVFGWPPRPAPAAGATAPGSTMATWTLTP